MNLEVVRFSDASSCTAGLLMLGGVFECYTIEDQHRDKKVMGQTRIPDGVYEVRYRQVSTPLTERYRQRYPKFFRWHLELQGVPGFSNVYIHVGNTAQDSDGCILVGDTINNNQLGPGFIGNSGQAFERLYRKVAAALAAGEQVRIKVRTL